MSDRRRGAQSVNVGNAGEHLLMAELLSRGYHAMMADRGNPAFDIAVILPDRRQVKVRAKTCGTNRTFQYNAKANGVIFLDHNGDDPADFCALVAPRNRVAFSARDTEMWIVPTAVMDAHLRATNDAYFSTPKRDGAPRRRQEKEWYTLRLDGPDTSPLNGWADKLASWRENWDFSVEPSAS